MSECTAIVDVHNTAHVNLFLLVVGIIRFISGTNKTASSERASERARERFGQRCLVVETLYSKAVAGVGGTKAWPGGTNGIFMFAMFYMPCDYRARTSVELFKGCSVRRMGCSEQRRVGLAE